MYGEGVTVICSGNVELAVVAARTTTTIRLWDDMKRVRPGRARGPDDPHLLHLEELLLGHVQLLAKETASPSKDWGARSRNSLGNTVLRWRGGVVHWRSGGDGREGGEDVVDGT